MLSGSRDWSRRISTAVRPGLGREPNPLRRRSDRLQGYSGLFAVLIVLAVLPVAVVLSLRTYHHFSLVSEQELASRQLISATVAASDPEARIARNHLATLTWTYPVGTEHSGHVAVTGSTQPGDLVPVWVDDRGDMTKAPMTRLNVWLDTLGVGVGLSLAGLVVALLWYRGTRRWLDHVRARELDAQWRRFNESRSEGFRT